MYKNYIKLYKKKNIVININSIMPYDESACALFK